MRMECMGISERGLVRKTNQDSIFLKINEYAGLCVVADGMGGHAHGERASQIIIQKAQSWWEQFSEKKYHYDFEQMIQGIYQALDGANKEIFQEYSQIALCGSTVLLLFLYKEQYAIFHAGDSRMYLLDRHCFRRMTVDDVWENQPERTEADRSNKSHPNYGHLTNALGIYETLRLRVSTGQLYPDMLFLLCSDGLYKMCSEKQMQEKMYQMLWNSDMKAGIQELKNIVYANGAKDNLAIVAVKLS